MLLVNSNNGILHTWPSTCLASFPPLSEASRDSFDTSNFCMSA